MAYDAIGPLLEEFLGLVEPHLTKPVSRAVLMPGNRVIEDECGDCEGIGGQLHVRLISIVGSSSMANPRLQPCAQYYQIRVAIGTRRCVHTIDDQGNPPYPAEMIADVKTMMQDRADIMEAIVCDIAPLLAERGDTSHKTVRIEDWLPSATGGGCQGGEVTMIFTHILCTECP
jgi:hypothetical protein